MNEESDAPLGDKSGPCESEHQDIEGLVKMEAQRFKLPRDLAMELPTSSSHQLSVESRALLDDLDDLYKLERRFYTRRTEYELNRADEIWKSDQELVLQNIDKWEYEEQHRSSADAAGSDEMLDMLMRRLRRSS